MLPIKNPSCSSCGSRSTSVIDALSIDELDGVTGAKRCQRFERNDTLFHEGQYPSSLFCIHSGHVKVYRTGADGKEQIIRFAGHGDVIGYGSILTGTPYATSAAAVEQSSVCVIPRELMTKLVRGNSALALKLMEMLSQELDDAERSIVRLAQKSIRERVAEALLVLRETFGLENDGETISAQLTREELANVVGTAPESVMRTLSDLRHDNLIETEGRFIRIKDLNKLAKVANLQD